MILMPPLHHFKVLLEMICQRTQQVFFEVKWNVGLNFARLNWESIKKSKESPDSFIEMLKYANRDCFPNICILLAIGCISPIGLTEAESAASGVRRLKTLYRPTMGDKRESDLKFLQLQRIKKVNPEKVSVLFIDLHKHRLFNEKITS